MIGENKFPAGGWCKDAIPELGHYLAKKFDDNYKPPGRNGYAWNEHSYWEISGESGKPGFSMAFLKKLIPEGKDKKGSDSDVDKKVEAPKYRFKTEEEFKADGEWDTLINRPDTWRKSSIKLLGTEVPSEHNSLFRGRILEQVGKTYGKIVSLNELNATLWLPYVSDQAFFATDFVFIENDKRKTATLPPPNPEDYPLLPSEVFVKDKRSEDPIIRAAQKAMQFAKAYGMQGIPEGHLHHIEGKSLSCFNIPVLKNRISQLKKEESKILLVRRARRLK